MSGAFGLHAAQLAAMGYEPIPITLPTDGGQGAGKRPAQREGWQNGCPREQWPAYARCGVGLLTRNTPALDIDVKDRSLAEQIQALADRVLGDAPYRIGEAPKRLLPFRLAGDPFPKIKVIWRGLGDEHHESTKPPAVEVLADGQQFVALGVHPDTRQPYQWHRDPDLTIPRDLLPPLDQARAERFVRALAGALERHGATDIRLSGITTPPAQEPRRPRPEGSAATDRERITAALERMGNADLHYDEWIKIGHAIKAELGEAGLPVWLWWSSLSSKSNEHLSRRKWATFNPQRITAGTIFWEAAR